MLQARSQGSDFVFEDTEDDDVWMHERRLAKDPIDFESKCYTSSARVTW